MTKDGHGNLPPAQWERTIVDSFGVGCFHVAWSVGDDEGFVDVVAYSEQLRAKFESCPHVVSVEELSPIEWVGQRFLPDNFDFSCDMASANGIMPWLLSFSIKILLDIPLRIQKEVCDHRGEWWEPQATKYEVILCYKQQMPVCFIRGVSEVLDAPSEAVMIVRKYFEQYFPDDNEMKFCSIGPSPFHADFYVCASTPLPFEISKCPGYDVVHYGILENETETDAVRRIQREVLSELEVYYRAVQCRNKLRGKWYGTANDIRSHAEACLSRPTKLKDTLRSTRLTKSSQLMFRTINLEIEIDEDIRQIRSSLDRVSADLGLERFKDYTEAELDYAQSFPIGRYKSIINSIEDQSRMISTNQIVLLSALIGIVSAAIGGLVGALVGGG